MPPKLEKLLLDTDLNVEVQPLLKPLGFRTRFTLHVRANERDDTDLLRWARRNGYIFVCHDKFRDKDTRLNLYPELYERGGKILRVGGHNSQEPLTAVGKIIVHRAKWKPWFEANDGIVVVADESRPTFQPAAELYTRVQTHLEGIDPDQRIRQREQRPRQRRPPQTSPTQQRLIR